ncbi:MAG: hypothetical protein QM704_21940 [Anaeromyxobacteraceae bacterium]
MPRPPALAVALLAVAGAACDPQANASSYRGEPLFEFDGSVVAAAASALPDVEVAVAWQDGNVPALTSKVAFTERNPVSRSGTTGTFTVRIYVPPPSAAYLALAPGEPRLGVATLGAFPPAGGTSGTSAPPYPAGGFYSAYDLRHWVVHLAADAPAGSATAWWLGGPAAAGFHLVELTDAGCPTAAEVAACVTALAALGVPATSTDLPAGVGGGGAQTLCSTRYRLSPSPAAAPVSFELGGPSGASDPWACP